LAPQLSVVVHSGTRPSRASRSYPGTGQQHIVFFFSNDSDPPEIYTLSLHDALPISPMPKKVNLKFNLEKGKTYTQNIVMTTVTKDRKSTRLNSSHVKISYAGFCLKKKKTT